MRFNIADAVVDKTLQPNGQSDLQIETNHSVRALGYVRRSKRSEERTVSLQEQESQIRAYCEAHGFKLIAFLRDDGVSGTKRERLGRISKALKEQIAQVVVVYHLDRFSRDIAGLLDHVKQYRRNGYELHVCSRGRVEIDSSSGFLTIGVEALLAEHYSRLISEKTRDALARLKAKGRRVSGKIPYGFKLAMDGTSLIPDPHEQEVKGLIIDLNRQGYGPRAILKRLDDRGIKSRRGRLFSPSTIHGILKREQKSNAV